MQLLLVAPYFGGSHRAWAEGYARHSRHAVTLLTLPARFWKWRMHGGAVTLAHLLRERLAAGAPRPDVVLATDMVNLPAFLGLTRDMLSGVPAVLYCHENQLTYPLQPGDKRDLTYPMINWLSMLAADCVLFNSRFHLENWFRALPKMLSHFPDCSHLPLVDGVRATSRVVPVGCTLHGLTGKGAPGTPAGTDGAESPSPPPLILWNQRWEYDKDPATFFRALRVLADRGLPFRVALAGSNVRQQPEEFEAARAWLGDRIVHYGRADRATYHRLLWDADIVVSTALHEFFGIAVVEAVFCATFPVLPKRLAYPELLPEWAHAHSLYTDFDGLVARLTWALQNHDAARAAARSLAPAMARFDWCEVAPQMDAAIEAVRHTL